MGIDTSLIALLVVGVVGLLIVWYYNNDKPFKEIVRLEELGYLLLGFAVCVGLMYTLTPIPTTATKREPIDLLFEGGDSDAGFEAGSVLDTITGGYLQKDTNTTLPTSHITYNAA